MMCLFSFYAFCFFFFNDTATTEIYTRKDTLSLHDALPISMTGARLDALHIPMMVQNNQATFGTAFTVSVDAREGVTTGISAADRARAIQVLASADSKPYDLVMPGHIYPLRAREGGVLVRAGQTEASVDLSRLAGLQPVAAICEL